MRHIGLLAVVMVLMMGQVVAQEPDALPEAIFPTTSGQIRIDYHRIAWIDNQMLAFDAVDEVSGVVTSYSYDLASATLNDVARSSFVATMSEETRAFYQVGESAVVHQSPYVLADGSHHVLYWSNLLMDCRPECNSSVILRSTYSYPELRLSTGIPTDFDMFRFLDYVIWSRDNGGAVIARSSPYGDGVSLMYWDLLTHDDLEIPVHLADQSVDRVLSISPNGKRVAITTSGDIDGVELSGDRQHLVVWETPTYDEFCGCTYDDTLSIIASSNADDSTNSSFAGVAFVDDDTILYIGALGLMRHNLLTGISTIFNPALNTSWIRTALFSPDFAHVAVITEQGLYILPLDF